LHTENDGSIESLGSGCPYRVHDVGGHIGTRQPRLYLKFQAAAKTVGAGAHAAGVCECAAGAHAAGARSRWHSRADRDHDM